jgi:hypothetical protein
MALIVSVPARLKVKRTSPEPGITLDPPPNVVSVPFVVK